MATFPSKYKKDSSESTGFLFIKAYNNWHSEIKERLKNIDITHPQYVVMATLGYLTQNNEEVTQVMLAGYADMDVMTVSQIIRLLEKKKLIERSNHSKDTRAKSIFLTKEGNKKIAEALAIVERIDELFFSSIEDKENNFKKYLKTLIKYRF